MIKKEINKVVIKTSKIPYIKRECNLNKESQIKKDYNNIQLIKELK